MRRASTSIDARIELIVRMTMFGSQPSASCRQIIAGAIRSAPTSSVMRRQERETSNCRGGSVIRWRSGCMAAAPKNT